MESLAQENLNTLETLKGSQKIVVICAVTAGTFAAANARHNDELA